VRRKSCNGGAESPRDYRSFRKGGIESERALLLFEGGLLVATSARIADDMADATGNPALASDGAIRRYFPSWRAHRMSALSELSE
jgi:hypothetical protein